MKTIRLPKGFLANGIHCGLKKKRKDLALFFSEKKCNCAALFTTNRVKAAPVVFCQEQLKTSKGINAIIVNSGNANCMTGSKGMKDTKEMASLTAKELGLDVNNVLVSSTGVIGKPMDMVPLRKGIKEIVKGLSADGFIDAAESIMTTDKFSKISKSFCSIGGKKISILGTTKGAGMIRPDMATTLCYILTDADVPKKVLAKALNMANADTFNSITVDGDMSTNDTVVLLANGQAGNKALAKSGKAFDLFVDSLRKVMKDLAKMIVRDGEGATKLVEINVSGAKTFKDAKKAADVLANSLLLKCAVHGGDPNWGRVASSIGASGIDFDPDKMEVVLDGVAFFKKGKYTNPGPNKAKKVFKGKDVKIDVLLDEGKASAKVYACDISKKYIAINSFYTT